MAAKPAGPGLGHGMDGVAQTGVVKIPEQTLSDDQRVAKLHRRHDPRKVGQGSGGIVGGAALGQTHHNPRREAHGVQCP